MRNRVRKYATRLKFETYALYLAYHDPRVPWYAKVFTAVVVAYAFSPVDLIPDFIPVLGYLDDVVVVPLGVMIALRMIPDEVLVESRRRAEIIRIQDEPGSKAAALVIVAIWSAVLAALIGGIVFK